MFMLGMGKEGKRVELDVGLIYRGDVGFMFRMDLFRGYFMLDLLYCFNLDLF